MTQLARVSEVIQEHEAREGELGRHAKTSDIFRIYFKELGYPPSIYQGSFTKYDLANLMGKEPSFVDAGTQTSTEEPPRLVLLKPSQKKRLDNLLMKTACACSHSR